MSLSRRRIPTSSGCATAFPEPKLDGSENSAAWASALGALQDVVTEVERRAGGSRPGPSAGGSGGSGGSGGQPTSGGAAPNSGGTDQKQCLVDSHTQIEPARSGVTYTYYVSESPVPGTNIKGYKLIQWSHADSPPSLPNRRFHGPHSSLSAARSLLDRLCPPSVRATDSLRLN